MFKWITAGAVAGMIAAGAFFMVDTTVSAQADDGSPALEQVEQRRGSSGHRGADRAEHRSERQAMKAEVLGLTVEELQDARDAGQRLNEIVEAQGMTMEEFHAEVQAAKIDQINQAIADGEMTQAEADAMIERIENGCGRGGSGHGGPERGGRGGPEQSAPDDSQLG